MATADIVTGLKTLQGDDAEKLLRHLKKVVWERDPVAPKLWSATAARDSRTVAVVQSLAGAQTILLPNHARQAADTRQFIQKMG